MNMNEMNDEMRGDESASADDWERMLEAFSTAAPEGSAPVWLEDRVMAEIDAIPDRGAVGNLVDWLLRPATVRVPPLAAGLVTAALTGLLLTAGRTDDRNGPGNSIGSLDDPDAVVYVQFILDAPGATSVAVAGDFSEWAPEFALDDADGDGVWAGRVPVRPGVHSYMFLIDGTDWRTDPSAERYQDDGFGNRNAVLAVAAGA